EGGVMFVRRHVAEWMDDPALPAAEHDRALRGLARLNAISRAHRLLWPRVRALSDRTRRPLRVLDLGSGGGDQPVRLDALARRHGVRLDWILSDCSAHALECARAHAAARGVRCEAVRVDALRETLPEADLVLNSLFLHHFDADDVVRILAGMRRAARLAVGVTDLRRTRPALGLVWLGSRALTRSPVVHHDAVASVRAAHEPSEIRALLGRADLGDATVDMADAVRWRLWWERAPGGHE
ncbi:MAG: methyltransferase domain-containing protein, partial [Planctomycetota bacterium]